MSKFKKFVYLCSINFIVINNNFNIKVQYYVLYLHPNPWMFNGINEETMKENGEGKEGRLDSISQVYARRRTSVRISL